MIIVYKRPTGYSASNICAECMDIRELSDYLIAERRTYGAPQAAQPYVMVHLDTVKPVTMIDDMQYYALIIDRHEKYVLNMASKTTGFFDLPANVGLLPDLQIALNKLLAHDWVRLADVYMLVSFGKEGQLSRKYALSPLAAEWLATKQEPPV